MALEDTEARVASGAGTATHHLIERPTRPLPGLRRLARDFGTVYAANGLIGLIFAATGPVAVILAVGAQGGLSQGEDCSGSARSPW